jgi:hypothetical protein
MRHDRNYKSWLVQQNRKVRQNASSPVIFAIMGNLDSDVSPSLVAPPALNIEGGTNYVALSWSSSDTTILDIDTSGSSPMLSLKAPGAVTLSAKFTNEDGSEYTTSKQFTIK